MLLKDRLKAIEQAKSLLVSLRPCESCKWYLIYDPVLGMTEKGTCNYDLFNCGSESLKDECDELHRLWESDIVSEK